MTTNGNYAVVNYLPHKAVICNIDDEERTLFGNHMYVVNNGVVFDACAGPQLGMYSQELYLTNTIDHSTVNEHASGFYSPYIRGSHKVLNNDIIFLKLRGAR